MNNDRSETAAKEEALVEKRSFGAEIAYYGIFAAAIVLALVFAAWTIHIASGPLDPIIAPGAWLWSILP